MAGYDHESINRTGIRKELQEFISFRNEILHDRQFEKPFEITWTSFSKYPPYLNILDVMQAMFIAQDTLQLFRKILPSNDIMPHVPITTTETAIFVKLDTVVRELIIPIFEQINRKHGLSSNMKYPHWPTPLGHGRGFSEYRIFFAIKAEPNVVYKGNSLVTGICQENETRFITNLGLKPGTITVPNYLDT